MCLAVPGRILNIEERDGLRSGRVQFGGITRQVNLDFVPEASAGDYVMVHVGFASSRVDEAEAKRSYHLLEEMGALASELPPKGGTSFDPRGGWGTEEHDCLERRQSRFPQPAHR